MSLRRKVFFVFLLVNVASVAALMAYARREANFDIARRQGVAEMTDLRQDLEQLSIRSDIDRELSALLERDLSGAELLLAIRNRDFFRQEAFARRVAKAVIVERGGAGEPATFFNLPRRFIFEVGELDRREAVEMVEESLKRGGLVERGRRIAGPLTVRGRPWGGFFLLLSEPALASNADGSWLPFRSFLLLLLPGALFLWWFTWSILNRGVLKPLDRLGEVAQAVMAGDFARRVPIANPDDEYGRVAGLINSMLDLVADYRDHMEAKVQQKTVELEKKTRELMLGQRLAAAGTLAAGGGHQNNNPLGGMLNALQRLRRADLSPEQRANYHELLTDAVSRIGSIVRRLLDVSPRARVAGPVVVAEQLGRAAALADLKASGRKVQIVVEAPAEPGLVILGDAHEFVQIFLNLLLNALDASSPGSEVLVSTRLEEGEVVIRVSDRGVGMTPEVAAQAFDHFFTTKEAGQGTGIGLAMVRSLVDSMQGSITFDSTPGQGTTFRVAFPRQGGGG